MAPIRPSVTSERGAALVEFALCVPLLLVVIAGIVDFGFTFQRYEVITNAAREGARLATLPQYAGNHTLIENRVRDYVQQGLSLSNASMNVVMPAGTSVIIDDVDPITISDGVNDIDLSATTVTVVYQHHFLLLQPILGLINKSWGGSMTLRAQSQMRNEQPFGGS